MNKYCAYLTIGLLSAVCVRGAVVVSNPEVVPSENMEISQLKTDGVILQSRHTKPSDWKGVGQSFKWESPDALDGIGLLVSTEQSEANPAYKKDLSYVLVVQELDGFRGAPVATIYQDEFILSAANVQPGKWLYLDIQDLLLKENAYYGFTLVAKETAVSSQRIYWATTADQNAYRGGDGNQIDIPVRGLPPGNGVQYGSAARDLTFYLQSTAEPEGGGVGSMVESNDPPAAWIPVGNEKEVLVARNVGRDLLGSITYLTEGNSIDTHFHYHGQTWGEINGRTYLFFSSSRARPAAAGQTVKGEQQIMAADAKSGDLYYLTTIPSDGVSFLSHMTVRSYNATYDDNPKSIFFWNKNRTVAYAYNCLTGAQKELFVLPDQGTSRELYSWSDDQMIRLIYTYSVPDDSGANPAYPRSEYLAIADLDYNFNVITNWVVKSTLVGGALNHPEINPKNKNLFFYQQKSGSLVNKKHENIDFLLHDLVSGTDTLILPDRGMVDHQIWGKSGNFIYWDNNRGQMCAYNWKTKEFEHFGEIYQGHNKLSSDEKLWVYDVHDLCIPGKEALFEGRDQYGVKYDNRIGSIWIYNRETQQRKLMTIFIWGSPHPRHPHAVFSQDDSMISFVTAANMTNENTRIAVMSVSE